MMYISTVENFIKVLEKHAKSEDNKKILEELKNKNPKDFICVDWDGNKYTVKDL